MVCIILYTISQFSDMVEGHTGRGRIWAVMRGDGRRLLPFRFEESQLRRRWNVYRQSQQLPRQPESLLHRSRKLSSRSSFSYLPLFFSSLPLIPLHFVNRSRKRPILPNGISRTRQRCNIQMHRPTAESGDSTKVKIYYYRNVLSRGTERSSPLLCRPNCR
jgi:hypothetical protein